MPFIRATTNVSVCDEKKAELKTALGASISIVSGKAECYLMLSIEDGVTMAYQGDMKTPLAMIEVQLLGEADRGELEVLTAKISEDISRILGIDESRIYINHTFFKDWGVGGALC
ncbi:MAG: hypothetical protein IKC32_06385 [Clostridia bacterium]|nr:hypothetical protein [Clostridia bacterium]